MKTYDSWWSFTFLYYKYSYSGCHNARQQVSSGITVDDKLKSHANLFNFAAFIGYSDGPDHQGPTSQKKAQKAPIQMTKTNVTSQAGRSQMLHDGQIHRHKRCLPYSTFLWRTARSDLRTFLEDFCFIEVLFMCFCLPNTYFLSFLLPINIFGNLTLKSRQNIFNYNSLLSFIPHL